MHSLQGSSASVSGSNTSSGGAGSPALSKQQRYSTRRSNSFSSASIVTVKQPTSLTPSIAGVSKAGLPMRAQSPSDTSLIAIRIDRDQMSQDHKRRKSLAVDPSERASSQGLANVDRWSQSTTSSSQSIKNTRRKRASSGAVLPGLVSQKGYAHKSKRNTGVIDYSPRASPQRRPGSRPSSRRQHSAANSPSTERADPLTALPPLNTIPGLTDPNDTESPSTIQTVTTPSAQSIHGQDYFGEDGVSPRSTAKSRKPVMIRHHTAPMSAFNSSRLQAVEGAHDIDTFQGQSDAQTDTTRESEIRSRHGREHERAPASREHRHKRSRTGEKGEKDKKLMLSKALQKANTAVLLDNAQNFEGALDAYNDACRLLQQVMDRSAGVDDKRKLEAIQVTYTNRIAELRQLDSARPEMSTEKSLPTRPMSDDSLPISPVASAISPAIDATFRGPASSPTIDTDTKSTPTASTMRGLPVEDAPQLSFQQNDRDSFFAGAMQAVEEFSRRIEHQRSPSSSDANQDDSMSNEPKHRRSLSMPEHSYLADENVQPGRMKSGKTSPLKPDRFHLRPESNYMPAPLSPRRPLSPRLNDEVERDWHGEQLPLSDEDKDMSGSWLDTIDEKASSRASSVHSVSSQRGLRRKQIRRASEESNPDLDAAFDAAVEAAYNEGLEPDLDSRMKNAPVLRKRAPTDSILLPSADIREISPPTKFSTAATSDVDEEDEEEERLLDEMTQEFAQTFNFDLSTKSALPRQSDSSGYSRSTWQSSQPSERTTAGTSLSTVNEDTLPSQSSKNAFAAQASLSSMLQDSQQVLGPPPQTALPRPPSMSQNRLSGVRSRRSSSQIPKQLKIETSTTKSDVRKRASTLHSTHSSCKEDEEHVSALDKDLKFGGSLESAHSEDRHERMLNSPPSIELRSAISDNSRPMTATTPTTGQRLSLDDEPGELLTHRPIIKQNKSSVSLREHMILLGSPTTESGPSAMTPMSSTFMNFASKRNIETALTSQRAAISSFGPTAADSLYSGGVHLFDTSLASSQMPTSPKSPGSQTGLEPCPESYLLRPFWLMRNIASTITHSKGGFLTTRLFVPREVWQTKGVKLKSIEDKISNCDLLTAALGRLAGVDTYDADAVMEELQSFEEIMERVQNSFAKRLGSDVGISGLQGLFKDAASGTASSTIPTSQNAETTNAAEKTKSKEGKGYLNSWRKLRSKSSGAPITGAQIPKSSQRSGEREAPIMATVPMTNFVPVERRGHRKDVRNMTFEGPNREYMGSLARLFEGVQVLDQIARQVEDPGLKGTSPTHVGLELSIRHASEFFGFYVCRFVLADLGILVDKFVKRSSEWVML